MVSQIDAGKKLAFVSAKRVLVVQEYVPEPDTNSGDLRLWFILRMLKEAGMRVTVASERCREQRHAEVLAREGIECVVFERREGLAQRFGEFLAEREFGVAVISHYELFPHYAPMLARQCAKCAVILDTVDLHHVREERMARQQGDECGLRRAVRTRQTELQSVFLADQVWVVTEVERAAVWSLGTPVRVIPNVHEIEDATRGFEAREGVVFLGGYRHEPNVDAVEFLVNDILPLVRRELPNVRVVVAGSDPPSSFLQYAQDDPNVVVTGHVADHRAVLKACRVGVAPLRYGAGMKGKIGEYMACGLPCVTTAVGAEGMGMAHGRELLVGESAAEIAQHVIRLYSDCALWESISRQGRDWVERNVSPAAVRDRVVGAVLEARARSPGQRLARRAWAKVRRDVLRWAW